MEASIRSVGWDAVEDALSHLVAGGESFELFVSQQFDELEMLRTQLAEREQSLRDERREQRTSQRDLERQWRRLEEARLSLEGDSQQIHNESARLARVQVDLDTARQVLDDERQAWRRRQSELDHDHERRSNELEQARVGWEHECQRTRAELAAHLTDCQNEAATLSSQAAALVAERDAARAEQSRLEWRLEQIQDELVAARGQVERLTAATVDLSDVRGELAAARAELVRLAQRPESRDTSETERALAQSEAELSHARRAAEQATHQRSALEQELASARSQVQRLTDATVELANLRGELAAARAELLRLAQSSSGTDVADYERTLALREADLAQARLMAEQAQLQREGLERELAAARGQVERLTDATLDLSEVRAELATSRAELLRRAEHSTGNDEAQWERAVAARDAELVQARQAAQRAEERYVAMESELAALREQTQRLTDTALELAGARAELIEARALLRQLAERPTVDPAQAEQLAELERERTLLEEELESVRRRVVEVAESAFAERQGVARERAEWSGELKQLRQLLERQMDRMAAPDAVAHVGIATSGPKSGVEPGPVNLASDPMLESVMAQFDMLQKDISRRRNSKPITPKT